LSEGGAPAGGSGTCYYVGNFDGHTFTSDDGKRLWIDAGKDNYAGTTWSNLGDGRTVFIGWMTNQLYSGQIPATTWRGCMTLPREWSLKRTGSDWCIIQKPLRELELLRGLPLGIGEALLTETKSLTMVDGDGAKECEIDLHIGSAIEAGLRLFTGEQQILIGIDKQSKQIFIDRTASGGFDNADFLQRHSASLDSVENVHLHVFIDTNSVEVYVNDGEIVFSELLFMDADHRSLEIYAKGGEATRKLYWYNLNRVVEIKW
jgi:sucrose-6-phosphate hydrolase SacC (GH32 family)